MSESFPHKEEISTLRTVFYEAEAEMHRTENMSQRTPVAALNELRYAASHVLSYLESRDCEELNLARQHCKRSYYDSQRFFLLYLFRRVQAIRDGMGDYLDVFVELVNKTSGSGAYYKLKSRITEAEKYTLSLDQIKRDSHRWNSREAFYQECMPHLEVLKEFLDVYENLREEFAMACRRENERRQEKLRSEKREKRQFCLMLVAIIVGLPSAAAALISIFSH